MASSPIEHRFSAPDGVELAWHELGVGEPLLLIHGYISDAFTNWIRFGHAARLADAGFRVIMPDLRGHGQSAKPHNPAAYPPDILAADQEALVAHLGLTGFHLGGYSLGGRTTARLLARGMRPKAAIISGMGLEGLSRTGTRAAHFRNLFAHLGRHPKGSAEWMAEAFLKTTGGDPAALALVLETFVDTPVETIRSFDLPVAVICGREDNDNGSAAALADALPQGRLIEVPGNHMSAVTLPDLSRAMLDFLAR